MLPKVSIVVPVYNAAFHLCKCLDSALSQTFDGIELVCIDDGSNDSSREILKEYAKRDKRVRIIWNDSNKGEGATRNIGLENARGEYIFNLDADDMLPPNAVALLYAEAVRHGSEMVKGGLARVYESGASEVVRWSTPDRKSINTNIYNSPYLRRIPTSHCTYLYSKAFLQRNRISYRSDLAVGLDLVALATALMSASTVTLIPDVVYHYFQSRGSAIRGPISEQMPLDAIRTQRIISDMFLARGLQDSALDRLQRWSYDIQEYWVRMANSLSVDACKRVFAAFRGLIGNRVVPWLETSPHHHRYILALALCGDDEAAISFLRSGEATAGFADAARLQSALELVLRHVPDDLGCLIALSRLTHHQANPDQAFQYIQRAMEVHPDHVGVRLQAARLFANVGQWQKARTHLDIAITCLGERAPATAARSILVEATRINRLEQVDLRQKMKKLRSDLNNARAELDRERQENATTGRLLAKARRRADTLGSRIDRLNAQLEAAEQRSRNLGAKLETAEHDRGQKGPALECAGSLGLAAQWMP